MKQHPSDATLEYSSDSPTQVAASEAASLNPNRPMMLILSGEGNDRVAQAEAYQLACDGYGPIPAKLMFVGISAGRRGALISKVPLTKDASGRIFQRAMKDCGFSLTDERSEAPELVDCYITNLVKGRCLTRTGLNRMPTQEEVDYWWPHLVGEMNKVKPEMIVALGNFVWCELDRRKMRYHRDFSLGFLKHPRWYQSHGALSPNSLAYVQLLKDWNKELWPYIKVPL